MVMSLETPEKIRNVQRKLYRKAKAEPAFRFYLLYDKIHREDILRHAYALARANAGAPGTDGMTVAAVEASGLERWLAALREVVADELGVDSLMAMEVMVAVDKKYKINIPEDEFATIKNVDDTVTVVMRHIASSAAA